MDGIAPPFTDWKSVVILLYDTRSWEVGILYYQQETGITTVVNFTSLPETRLVSRFWRLSPAAPPVSHHLIQLYARKIIQSLPVEPVDSTNIV